MCVVRRLARDARDIGSEARAMLCRASYIMRISGSQRGLPEVEKVLFVVDRSDLDTQTVREFNAFKENSVDTTKNTSTLVAQLGQTHDKLIVTTLQKLNIAISSDRYADQIGYLKDKKVVIIFDKCHRSQFGDTHRNIKRFFYQAQMNRTGFVGDFFI